MVFSDWTCVSGCPTGTIEANSPDWCAPICPPGSFADLSVALSPCVPCNTAITGCNTCEFDTEDD